VAGCYGDSHVLHETGMNGMLLAGEDKSLYLLLFGDNEEILVSIHESDGGRWLDAPAGSTCENACSIVLQMQRGIADRSAIPCFICSTTENASPQHPAKESRAQNSAARSL
jgi:hypothetical protein